MSQLTAICRALDFVEEHLSQEITVADMGAAACYSPYHFSRTFNRVVHHTPYDYLMRRRLSESARQLLETDKKIIDIALEYGFNNPETYSRAFKRMFGVQPSQWRGGEGRDEALIPMPEVSPYRCGAGVLKPRAMPVDESRGVKHVELAVPVEVGVRDGIVLQTIVLGPA